MIADFGHSVSEERMRARKVPEALGYAEGLTVPVPPAVSKN